jgi:probable HAF family extracellular repeat protein
MNTSSQVRLALFIGLCCTPASGPIRAAATFTPLGDLPGGEFISDALGVSADGSVVVGVSSSKNGFEAFRWTAEVGMVGLGDLPGGAFESGAVAVSADGSVVVGHGSGLESGVAGFTYEPFRWTASGGMVGLGKLPDADQHLSFALDISADGSVIVGYDSPNVPEDKAFLWTASGGLVRMPSARIAVGVSADGSVVVGQRDSSNSEVGGGEAFRWTADGGFTGLGDLPGGAFLSYASKVSDDGSVVVGFSVISSDPNGIEAHGFEAFRWTADGSMVGLGDLPGGRFSSNGWDVSADGSVVVGESEVGGDAHPFSTEAFYGLSLSEWSTCANFSLSRGRPISLDGNWSMHGGYLPTAKPLSA